MSLSVKVTGALIKKGEKFLIGRRAQGEKSPGLWEFPGGKLEDGETLKECIKRELKEELSINAEIGNLFLHYNYHYPHISYKLYFFNIKKYKGDLIKTVHDKLKWVRLEDFHKYNFLAGDEPLIEKLKQAK